MKDAGTFFIAFFLLCVPMTIAALNPHSKLSIGQRLAALGAFVIFIIIIFRVYVLGVPENQVFRF